MFFHKHHNKRGEEIAPDDIFLDSSNLPDFDTDQFEGRLEKTISRKTVIFVGCFFALLLVLCLVRVGNLQLKQGENYLARSENNRLQHSIIFSERGVIYDRNGEELARNSFSKENQRDFFRREYSEYSGLAHILGYVSYPKKDSSGNYYQDKYIGKSGVESFFNEKLSGANGLKIVEKNALLEIKSESTIQPSKTGESVTLSIDARVQNVFYGFISDLARRVGFNGGAGVIMDVRNGEILALVNYPEYDLKIISDGENKKVIEKYIRDENKPFLNRATMGLYTPGSIVKPFLALGALNEKIISPTQQILSTGSIVIPNPYFPKEKSIFKDWKAHGWVDLKDALAVSSNVYFYEIGGGYEKQKGLGIKNINKYIKLFGFNEESGIEAFIEERGIVPNPEWKAKMFNGEIWRIGDTYHTAIGQYGFQVTPLQVARAMGALANNGRLLRPTIILGRGNAKSYKNIAIEDEYFQIVKDGLRQAVTAGTAQGLNLPFIKVSAKTGTAERGTAKKKVNSWITGFFPSDAPRYAFVVLMEEGPQENQIGGLFVFRQLLKWMRINTPEYLTGA
ncbi:MAG: hypothetical protein KAV41_00515 [Candidatus Pacebacteria bacterium]|nr:hypothetical protein [Candidatus Paceibacterota bacterium]